MNLSFRSFSVKPNQLLFFGILSIMAISCVSSGKPKSEGNTISFQLKSGKLELNLCTPSMVRVSSYANNKILRMNSLSVVNNSYEPVKYSIEDADESVRIKTQALTIVFNKNDETVNFFNSNDIPVLSESVGTRKIKAFKLNGKEFFQIEQGFEWENDEGLYGLGQQQNGDMNYRGKLIRLFQDNTTVACPVLISSKGYGIFWDNYSLTEFRDTLKSNDPTKNSRCGTIWSEAGNGINYYFIYGPKLDQVISQYRKATGESPLFGKWAYGLWQSKEHYHTQKELLDVVKEYRERQVPLDNIVQDWFYWEPLPWGSHNFDRSRYPDPSGMVRELHEKYNTHAMISVWARFAPGSPNYEEMQKAGFLFPASGAFGNSQYYDPYNPDARKMYWKQIHDSLYVKGFDGWWLDATEPEIGDLSQDFYKNIMNNKLGPGMVYLNTYPLMTTTAVYEGLRKTSEKRAFILTRSAFPGQQRNAAATWSGDINGTWDIFKKQIASGINFCYSGIPYWTTDIGGFFVNDYAGGNKNDEYRELFTRWYQFGAFCPIFRVHGTKTPREIYYFGEPGDWAYDAQLEADQLRYRLMPYLYSIASEVTRNGYTILRGLQFDFSNDSEIKNISDQFMFGPAFLVNPVTFPIYHKDFLNFSGVMEAIPSEFLTGEENEPGLVAEYFNGINFNDKVLEERSPGINFNWKLSSPNEKVSVDSFSVRWRGYITVPETGDYPFITYADDGVRLWVNNQLIIDDWTQHDATFRSGTAHLIKGKTYPIKLDYMELIGGANVTLSWIPSVKKRDMERLNFEAAKNTIKSRSVYLPRSAGWFDFWTCEFYKGGQFINAQAPMNKMPLFVKAGSIVPMGPFLQYATEKPAEPIELRIYPGEDASFQLYEDENDTYNYENGAFSIIPIQWLNKERVIRIGDRQGSFPGMLEKKTFNIVVVGKAKGNGLPIEQKTDTIINYMGKSVSARF